jgi:hypothetical protein
LRGRRETIEPSNHTEAGIPEPEARRVSWDEKARRWLIIIGTVALWIFIIYLLLILIYPSMDIGVNP